MDQSGEKQQSLRGRLQLRPLCLWPRPAENKDTGKIREYVYQRESDARKRLTKLKSENNIVVTIATHDEILLMTPMTFDY